MRFRANGYFRWCGRSCLEQNLTGYLQQVFGYLSAGWPSPGRDSLIRRINSLMARLNSLLGRNKFPVPVRRELPCKPLNPLLH
jgi:hypothetical protein